MIKTKVTLEPEALSFDGKFFTQARAMLDIVLQNGIKTIHGKGIDKGTLTMSLNIKLEENCSEDTPHTVTYIPIVDYKVGFGYKDKIEQSGLIGGADMQLVTENGEDFTLRSDPHGQLEMDLD